MGVPPLLFGVLTRPEADPHPTLSREVVPHHLFHISGLRFVVLWSPADLSSATTDPRFCANTCAIQFGAWTGN
jgi:hypothetical protein